MTGIAVTGHILTPSGLSEGYVVVDRGIVTEVGKREALTSSSSAGIDVVEGLIVPGFLDMHTHLGDRGARGRIPRDLASAVDPGGVKDSFLSSSERSILVDSYRSAFRELSGAVSLVLDYRERGLEGISIAQEAVDDPRLKILGRPHPGDDPERILHSCDGFGIPSLEGADPAHRDLARELEKIYSIHASELFREDIGPLIDLDPDLVIHMIKGKEDDWKELVRKKVPVCVCPRANLSFSLDVPLGDMFRSGLPLTIGTDNAMAVRQDMFREMEEAWLLLRREGFEAEEASKAVFDMLTGASLAGTRLTAMLSGAINSFDRSWPNLGEPASFFVLRISEDDSWMDNPFDHVVRSTTREDLINTRFPEND